MVYCFYIITQKTRDFSMRLPAQYWPIKARALIWLWYKLCYPRHYWKHTVLFRLTGVLFSLNYNNVLTAGHLVYLKLWPAATQKTSQSRIKFFMALISVIKLACATMRYFVLVCYTNLCKFCMETRNETRKAKSFGALKFRDAVKIG